MDSVLDSDCVAAPCGAEKAGLRERQRLARGEAILQAAFALITEDGYEALTMEGVAERVGITRQTLYHHFASKEEIVLRAIITIVDESTRMILSIDPELPAIERLKNIMRWMMDLRFSPTPAAFFKARLSLLPLKTRPEYKVAFERRTQALARIVGAAQKDGHVQPALPPELIVQMLLGMVSDAQYEGLIADKTTTPTDVTEAVLDVFFNGLRPAPQADR